MSPATPDLELSSSSKDQHANIQAALARTLTRSIALYFSRPVRLFRPSKVSGWHSLQALASHHGSSLTLQYVIGLLKTQGFIVIPKHFIPPMLINAFLGTVLWTTYTETLNAIEPHFVHYPTLCAGLSGAVAGGTQALLAAPAENVRMTLQGGPEGSPWPKAWKEVFRGTEALHRSKKTDIAEIRQLRIWMKEVGEMAGRGWNGWGWGLGKDICGFAAFFSVFEITRRIAVSAKGLFSQPSDDNQVKDHPVKYELPLVIHGLTLVTGGVIAGVTYERITLPWDVSRRLVELERSRHPPSERAAIYTVLLRKLRDDGIWSFFKAYGHVNGHEHDWPSRFRRHLHNTLRTMGRVGPWGIGFLVWEVYGH